jgi:hypothetical protein
MGDSTASNEHARALHLAISILIFVDYAERCIGASMLCPVNIHRRSMHPPLISCLSSSPSPSAPSSRSSAPQSRTLAQSGHARSCCISSRRMRVRRSSLSLRLWRIRGVGGLGPVDLDFSFCSLFEIRVRQTHAWEFDAAVTAFWG